MKRTISILAGLLAPAPVLADGMMGGYGMMGSASGWPLWSILWVLGSIGIVVLVWLGVIKLWSDLFGTHKKKK